MADFLIEFFAELAGGIIETLTEPWIDRLKRRRERGSGRRTAARGAGQEQEAGAK